MPDPVRVGVIGWNYPEWRGLAYPPDAKADDLLPAYARLFPVVEVAASYYRAPDVDTLEAWARATPEGFTFSFKVPDWITRTPDEEGGERKIQWFVERVEPIRRAGKLGALVAQFPPFFRREKKADALRTFVERLPPGHEWAVELRHASWWHEDTYRLLRDAGVTLVWNAIESGRAPPVATTDRLYLRLFGDRSLEKPWDRKRRDAADELSYWVERIRDEGRKARQVDVLVSKYLEGYAPGSVATMCEMLGIREPDVGDRRGRHEARQTTLPV